MSSTAKRLQGERGPGGWEGLWAQCKGPDRRSFGLCWLDLTPGNTFQRPCDRKNKWSIIAYPLLFPSCGSLRGEQVKNLRPRVSVQVWAERWPRVCHRRAALSRHKAGRLSTSPCASMEGLLLLRASECSLVGRCSVPTTVLGGLWDARLMQPARSPLPGECRGLCCPWASSFVSFVFQCLQKIIRRSWGPFAQVTFNPHGGCNEVCTAHPFY